MRIKRATNEIIRPLRLLFGSVADDGIKVGGSGDMGADTVDENCGRPMGDRSVSEGDDKDVPDTGC